MQRILAILLISAFLLSACSLLNNEEADPDATPTAGSATPQPPPSPEVTAQVPDPDNSGPTILNVWVVDDVNPAADTASGILLAEQLATFETNRPDLEINVELKTATGPGSTLAYLRTGREVAPSILPDLIVLSADQLEIASAEQLIIPMNNLLVPDAVTDLFPAADVLAREGEQIFGYPFTVNNLSHAAFDSKTFSDTLPLTWDDFIDYEGASFTFPGSGLPGTELALQMYLASGGVLESDSGQPILEVEPLAEALNLLRRGRREGLLPAQTATMTVLEESWQAYASELANSVQTVEKQYMANFEDAPDSNFSAIPGPENPLPATIKAWTWAISTLDPERQTLVADLLNWLIAAPNMGDWTSAAGTLPSRRSAFEQWPNNDEYIQFLQQELERAEPYPYIAQGAVMSAVGLAVTEVLSLSATAQQAAQDAVDSLAP